MLSSDNVTGTYLLVQIYWYLCYWYKQIMFVAIHHSTTFPFFGPNEQLFEIQLKLKSVSSLLDSS